MNRKISFVLALLMLVSAVSCGSSAGTEKDDTSGNTEESTTVEETEKTVTDDLGDIRFDGEEFNIYLAFPVKTMFVEEETGDNVDDAIWERNRAVEERLGISLKFTEGGFATDGGSQGAATQQIRSFVMSGDTSNDLFIHVQHSGMPGLISEGCFIDWNTLPNVDFSKPYWYANCIRDINYGNKIYAMTGMYNLEILRASNILAFNKRLVNEAGYDYPYQLVLDGKWTYDRFVEMVASATRDLNGDTIIDPNVDQFGYWGWVWESVPSLYMALGGDVITKDKDNMPVISIETERNIAIVEKMNELFAMDGAAYETATYGTFNAAFKNGTLMFDHSSLGDIQNMRDMKDDFGFVPYPKFDEAQEGYNVRVGNCAGLSYIPVTNTRPELTGAVLEVMSAVSYNTVVPAYFDVALTVKIARDTESEQMIPIINDSASFYDEAADFSIILVITSGESLPTYYAKVKNKVADNVQKLITDVYKAN